MKGIYSFFWDCGRSGDLDGIFIADSKDVAKVIGKNVYFGEVLGKHSEVEGILEAGDIELKTDDQAFIAQFEQIMGEGFSSGFDPIERYMIAAAERDDYDEEDEEDEE
jgi:hypothetical protein